MHLVANQYAVLTVPESHFIEEAARVGIGELQAPMRTAIRSLIHARFVAWADAKQIG